MRFQHSRRQAEINARVTLLLLVCVALTGCGAVIIGDASAIPSSEDDVDHEALNEQAGTLLLDALRTTDRAGQALLELRGAGTAGLPWIERALRADEESPTSPNGEAIHAELLLVLASLGDVDAARTLRGSTSSDPVALACRIAVLEPSDHLGELRMALQHTSERVRVAALRRLRDIALTPDLLLAVTERSRIDPTPSIRAEALTTLAAQGSSVIETLEAQLLDRDLLPRSVAMRELARIDCPRALDKLAGWLSAAPSRDGMAAVRALAKCGDSVIARTIDQLRRALASSDVGLRSEAAATADAMAWRELPDWIATPLAHDPVPSVRLALALAVRPTHPEAARATLTQLARGPISMVSVQAAAFLAAHGEPSATTVLRAALTQRDAKLRRVAFTALGAAPGHASELATGLRDPDFNVRLATAGALLRLTHPML